MSHCAVFRFRSSSPAVAYAALCPEMEDLGRSRVDIRLEGSDTLVLDVIAEDVHAMRAALNTWLRLIMITEDMQEIVANGQ